MMSLVNKSVHWTPNYHKILIFSQTKSLKSPDAARIDELADSNEPAIIIYFWIVHICNKFVFHAVIRSPEKKSIPEPDWLFFLEMGHQANWWCPKDVRVFSKLKIRQIGLKKLIVMSL